MNLANMLDVATEAAALGSDQMVSMAPGVLTAKGDRDYASEVDYAIEDKIRSFLVAKTPEVGFVGEETWPDNGQKRSDGYWWALDPIDGTVNFAHGLPLCAVSLALFRNDRPVVGVVDNPHLKARYTAIEGQGAFCGDERLDVSTPASLAESVVTIGDYAVGDGAAEKNKRRLLLTQKLADKVLRIRMLGSAAMDLVWLAQGRTGGSVTLSNSSWDIGAGVIIAREAGAAVFDLDGSEHTTASIATIACPPSLKPSLLSVLANV